MSSPPLPQPQISAKEPSPWQPLSQPDFRLIWFAVLASNIGTWIDSVATAWLVAEMTGSPLMLGLVQAAQTLPVILLALLAGALADIVDRRRYLIATQIWMCLVATTLATMAALSWLSPWLLIGLTFALGLGNAMALPAQSAITPELVPKPLLARAAALNSLGINVARAIGPALGGLILANLGAAIAYGVNALSYLVFIVALLCWRRNTQTESLPPEQIGGAILAGLRYVRRASIFRAVLIRALAFFLCAAALTALLPLVAKHEANGGANGFGLLLAAIGIGAIAGALSLPALHRRLNDDHLIWVATLGYAIAMALTAWLNTITTLLVVSLLSGFTWICVLSTLQVAAQTSVPGWVRARALSLYVITFSLGQTLGSLAWGSFAQYASVDTALLVAAAGAAALGSLAMKWRIAPASQLDLSPSQHWPHPDPEHSITPDRSPAMIQIEYRIDTEDRIEFLRQMQQLGIARRRDGAVSWHIVEDIDSPGLYVETFLLGSWLEHLRQHHRVTADDQLLQQQILKFHRGTSPPKVRHLVGPVATELPLT